MLSDADKRAKYDKFGRELELPAKKMMHCFQLFLTIFNVLLLVLKGIYHYWTYVFSRELSQMEHRDSSLPPFTHHDLAGAQ